MTEKFVGLDTLINKLKPFVIPEFIDCLQWLSNDYMTPVGACSGFSQNNQDEMFSKDVFLINKEQVKLLEVLQGSNNTLPNCPIKGDFFVFSNAFKDANGSHLTYTDTFKCAYSNGFMTFERINDVSFDWRKLMKYINNNHVEHFNDVPRSLIVSCYEESDAIVKTTDKTDVKDNIYQSSFNGGDNLNYVFNRWKELLLDEACGMGLKVAFAEHLSPKELERLANLVYYHACLSSFKEQVLAGINNYMCKTELLNRMLGFVYDKEQKAYRINFHHKTYYFKVDLTSEGMPFIVSIFQLTSEGSVKPAINPALENQLTQQFELMNKRYPQALSEVGLINKLIGKFIDKGVEEITKVTQNVNTAKTNSTISDLEVVEMVEKNLTKQQILNQLFAECALNNM